MPSALQAALLTALPLFMFLVVGPTQIYIGNPQYLDHQYQVVLHLAAVHLLFVLLLFLLFRAVPRLRRGFSYFMGLFGIYLIAIYELSPSVLKELPQGGLRGVEEPWNWIVFEALLAVALLVLILTARVKALLEIASIVAGSALLALPLIVIFDGLTVDNKTSRWQDKVMQNDQKPTQTTNVYHLIFDGFDGSKFGTIINDLGLVDQFKGFVWYSNAYSNYTSTAISFPSFMTGRVFDNSITDQSAGVIGRSEGLIKDLARRGVTVSQYNSYFLNNHVKTHRRFSTLAIERTLYGNLRHIIQLLDLSFLVIAPTVFKQEMIVNSRGLISHMLRNTSLATADWTRNTPMLSRLLFAQMLNDLAQLPKRGQYLNAHLLLPHTPPTLSIQCAYEPDRPQTSLSFVEQNYCATLTINEFIDRLRQLNRFEDSMIIFQSDHGTWKPERPLLLVKYPGASNEPLVQVAYPVQLLDVAPTIREILGLEYDNLEGMPLRSVREDTQRKFSISIAVRK